VRANGYVVEQSVPVVEADLMVDLSVALVAVALVVVVVRITARWFIIVHEQHISGLLSSTAKSHNATTHDAAYSQYSACNN